MKKIFILALTFLLLSVLPAFADGTEVYVTDSNNIAEDLLVTVKTTNESFEGALIEVGDNVTYTLEAFGAGMHTANVDISKLGRVGDEIKLTVTANFGGEETEVIEKTVAIYKMSETVANYTKDNSWLLNIAAGWNGAEGNTTAYNLDENGNETDDNGSLLIKWKEPFKNGDTRIGFQTKDGANAEEGIYYIEHDIYFIYGNEGKVPVPDNTQFGNYFRTLNAVSYPVNTDGKAWDDFSINKVIDKNSGGKLYGGPQLYTNTWYRIRIVIDKYTKDENGKYTGGLRYYYAVADESGNFGDFNLFANYPKVYLPAIYSWRYEFRAPDAAFSFAFKNFKFTYLKPQKANYWYLDGTEYSDNKVKLTFSEDMGTVSASSIKVFNKLNFDENGEVIYEEIPVSSITAGGVNEYVLTLPKTLLYGKDYEIRLENNFTSSAGSIGFKEPAADDNSDGFWNFSVLTAPKYPVNITNVVDNGSTSVVNIENPGIGGKYIGACWYTEEGEMVDFDVLYIAEGADDNTITFNRNNNREYAELKAYVFDLDTDPESDESGKVVIYESN